MAAAGFGHAIEYGGARPHIQAIESTLIAALPERDVVSPGAVSPTEDPLHGGERQAYRIHEQTTTARDRLPADQQILPVLPLRDVVVYPHMVIPLFVGREKSIQALDTAMEGDKQIMLVASGAPPSTTRGRRHLPGRHHRHGPAAAEAAGRHRQGAGGGPRARPSPRLIEIDKQFIAQIALLKSTLDRSARSRCCRAPCSQFEQYVKLNRKIPPEVLSSLASIEDVGRLADTIAAHMSLKLDERRTCSRLLGTCARLEKLMAIGGIRDRRAADREAHPRPRQARRWRRASASTT
jgi:ATP-dependent Lon protease